MNRAIFLAFPFLILAGCAPKPPECTAETIAKSENQSAIFRVKVTDALSQRHSPLTRRNLARNNFGLKFGEPDQQVIAKVIEQKQLEWNQAQIEINSKIDKADLEKICQFIRSETVSLTLLQELKLIGQKKQQTSQAIEQKIIDKTLDEIYKLKTN